ncbi:heterokaryon incompatibility protein-domain-containing protein [Corynascus novoguineensis]|uniref:Heterokaryon incompatibility protein-domain-containing protein n=1 Tax=Corynascus novoguineensis TaxID=1126955 RepID=A0AAN7CSP4_9PEZI|nr:heterokaryon incompatibility protein-domain-containing protein [Corynascus novoguineensis]
MWLINNRTKGLEFVQNPKEGSYAILSHTWGDDEVSFQQYQQQVLARRSEQGLEKILKTCELALMRGLPYSWVDTCCIDKLSSAELSEAINSMFKWYKDSAVCFVHLSDIGAADSFGRAFAACRWLKRGWTLQELIAPRHVEFYDAAWKKRTSKAESLSFLSNCTGIDREVLEDSANLSRIPIARRMSWASMRETTRVEDTAYCLMGIFGIHMSMIYGEGANAFIRLQEEIAKQSCDLSLFAWTSDFPRDEEEDRACSEIIPEKFRGIFARSPREFFNSGNISAGPLGVLMEREFTITNKGVRIKTSLVQSSLGGKDAILNLGIRQRPQTSIINSQGWIGIYLAMTPVGYVRSRPDRLYTAGNDTRVAGRSTEIYIRKDISALDQTALANPFLHSIHLRAKPQGASTTDVMPTALWDPIRQIFLHQALGINAYVKYNVRCCDLETFQVMVGCSTIQEPTCQVWTEQDETFSLILEYWANRTELSDYVAVDYFRVYFYRNSRPGVGGTWSTPSMTRFKCRVALRQVVVAARLVAGEHEGTSVYFLDVDSAVQVSDSYVVS